MPEYPDVELYRHALGARVVGARLERFGTASPHLLRSVEPPPESLFGRPVEEVARIGKQLVLRFREGFFCALHLAVAGRLYWTANPTADRPTRLSPRGNLAVFGFESGPTGGGDLRLVERSPKKRATIRLGHGEAAFRALDRGGLEIPGSRFEDFAARLAGTNRTLKRVLTEPARYSGVGNAYSDEILHRARLSPMKRCAALGEEETRRLHCAAGAVLSEWAERLRRQCGAGFPTGVTAFREGMAVHGRFGKPCPDCGTEVQRVRRAENEVNYCPRCQTRGRLLADRAMSRLLRRNWPRSLKAQAARRRRLASPSPKGAEAAPSPRGSAPSGRRGETGGRKTPDPS